MFIAVVSLERYRSSKKDDSSTVSSSRIELTVVFITVVSTVIVSVTLPGGSDAVTIVTGELSGGAACCEKNSCRYCSGKQDESSTVSSSRIELTAMVFITVVSTVIVGVTLPGGSDAVTIVTGELSGGAACCERNSSLWSDIAVVSKMSAV